MTGSGKYGDLIKKAREPENQNIFKPDDQTARQPEPDDQPGVKPDDQQTINPDEKQVNLCVKVPESLRRHWAAEAKRSGVTMTEIMMEALTEKFGLPDDQATK